VTRARILVACIACAVATAAFPATGLAQTAGQAEYGGVAGAVVPPSGVAGQTVTGSAKPKAKAKRKEPVSKVVTTGTLPFTGRDLLLMTLAGLALVGVGVALRTAARAPSRA
jgi:hypothetical protein